MKSKWLGYIALASCVMLAGCGDEPSDPVDPVEKAITISAFTENIYPGVEVDLASHITVSGGKGTSYTIEFSDEDFEKIDFVGDSDTVITPKVEGEIKFTVDYEGLTKEGSFVAGNAFFNKFMNTISGDIGYNYGVYVWDYDDYDMWVDEYLNFSDRYYVNCASEDYDLEGYIEADDGEVYVFAYDGEADEFIYEKSATAPSSVEEFCGPFDYDPSLFSYKLSSYQDNYGKTHEYETASVTDEDTVNKMTSNIFGYDVNSLAEYDITPIEVLFSEEELEFTGSDEAVFTYYAELVVEGPSQSDPSKMIVADLDFVNVQFGEDAVLCQPVIDLINSEEGVNPKPRDLTAYTSLISDAVSAHNFTVSYSTGWSELDPDTGALIEELDVNPFADDEESVFPALAIVDPVEVYVTETQTYSKNGEDKYSSGLVTHEEKAYRYIYDEANSNFKAILVDDTTGIFGPSLRKRGDNYLFLEQYGTESKSSLDEIFFSKPSVEEVDDNNYSVSVMFGEGATSNIYNLLMKAVPESHEVVPYGKDEGLISDWNEYVAQIDNFDAVLKFFKEYSSLLKYVGGEMDVEVTDGEVSSLTFIFSIGDYSDYETYEHYYQYSMIVEFDFTATAIPSIPEIVYPGE